MAPDRQRARVLDFVAQYFESPAVLVTSADNTAATSAQDFNGRRLGVERSSSYERYLNHELVIDAPGAKPIVYTLTTAHVTPYENEELAFRDLALGAGRRIDAVLSNQASAKTRMERTPGKFRMVGEPLFSEPSWIAVDRTGDAEWKAKIVTIVREMKRDGTLTRLSQKWFGRDITR